MTDFDFVPGQPNGIFAYTTPFRLVYRDEEDIWDISVKDINQKSYNYVKLHRISTSLDIGLPYPLCLHVTFDGTLILPNLNTFIPREKAVYAFNEFLGQLALGGVFFESVESYDIDLGLIYETGYARTFGLSKSISGELRNTLKTKMASPLHSIKMLNAPHVTAWEIHKAFNEGKNIFHKITNLSPIFVIYGITAYVKHNWVETIANLWISIEQLVSYLWDSEVVSKGKEQIIGRRDFLKDARAWPIANQIEILYQIGHIDGQTYSLFNKARKCRNALIHNGTLPDSESSMAAMEGFLRTIASITDRDFTYFSDMLSKYQETGPPPEVVNKISKRPVKKGEGLWLGPIPPIPGEKEWGDNNYEKVPFEQS